MPAVLQQLMRHESIDTTMKFYVGRNAEATAAILYAAVGNILGNTPHSAATTTSYEKTKNLVSQRLSASTPKGI